MKTVEEVVLEVLNLPLDTPTDDDFGVDTCEQWNSLAQIGIVVSMGNNFDTSFTLDEGMNMDTIGGIKNVLKKKGLI
jgi:acyl carrier protein